MNLYLQSECLVNNLFSIKWHTGADFNCSTASGYSFVLGKFCILMIQNHSSGRFDGIISFPFVFNTKQEINVIVTDNDSSFSDTSYNNTVGWTREYGGKAVRIKTNIGGGFTILVIGILA